MPCSLQQARSSSTGRGAEAAACQGYFFDGLDQISKLSHGVYEGSYWQLLGDLSELEDMLSRMIRAPALLDEPTLELPPQPELPKWVAADRMQEQQHSSGQGPGHSWPSHRDNLWCVKA